MWRGPILRSSRAKVQRTSFARCTIDCSRSMTRSRSGRATWVARYVAAPISISRPPRRSVLSVATIALRGFDQAEFVEEAVATLGDRPPNVEHIVALNRGPLVEDFGTATPLTPHEVEAAVAAGAVVIDGRTNEEFDESHIGGALSTSAYDTGFATKVSRVAPRGAELIVVAACDGDERQAAELLAAVGLPVRGFLEGGMTAWRNGGSGDPQDRADQPRSAGDSPRRGGASTPLDVRNRAEYAASTSRFASHPLR